LYVGQRVYAGGKEKVTKLGKNEGKNKTEYLGTGLHSTREKQPNTRLAEPNGKKTTKAVVDEKITEGKYIGCQQQKTIVPYKICHQKATGEVDGGTQGSSTNDQHPGMNGIQRSI